MKHQSGVASFDAARHGSCTVRGMGDACRKLPEGYHPRDPRNTLLHRVVSENLGAFEEEWRARDPSGSGLPKNVKRAFEAFLKCGILENGFVRVRCRDCGYDLVVPFS